MRVAIALCCLLAFSAVARAEDPVEPEVTPQGLLPPIDLGGECATTAEPVKCCKIKSYKNICDDSCKGNECNPPAPIVGDKCGSLPPHEQRKCCWEKKSNGIWDPTCKRPRHDDDDDHHYRPRPRSCKDVPRHWRAKCCWKKFEKLDFGARGCASYLPRCSKFHSHRVAKKCCRYKKSKHIRDRSCKKYNHWG